MFSLNYAIQRRLQGWYVYHPDQNTGGIYTPRNLHTYGWYMYHPTGGIYTTPGFLPIKFFSSPRFVLSRNVLILKNKGLEILIKSTQNQGQQLSHRAKLLNVTIRKIFVIYQIKKCIKLAFN